MLSLLVAPANDVATAEWFSPTGPGSALSDYLTVLAGVAGWAVFGTTLAVIFRSAPLALGVGFAWAGPFENIVVYSWDAGGRRFPPGGWGPWSAPARPRWRWAAPRGPG